MKELQIERILSQESDPAGMWVVLKEKRGQRRIPICIGQFEGAAIIRGLENLKMPRPWTHDLLASVLEELGAEVKHIVLTNWQEENQTFYAVIVIESNGTTQRIDARPSDALALAVIKKVPIFAEEALLKMGAKPKAAGAEAKAAGAQSNSGAVPPLVTLWPVEKENAPPSSNKRQKKTTKRT